MCWNLSARAAVPHQMYVTGCDLHWTWKHWLRDISLTIPLIFTGGRKNFVLWPRFPTAQTSLRRYGFETSIEKLKHSFGSPMIGLCYAQIQCDWVYPTLRWRPGKLRREKRAEEMCWIIITRSWVVRFSWNLVQSLNTSQPIHSVHYKHSRSKVKDQGHNAT